MLRSTNYLLYILASLYYDAALIFLKKPFDLQSAPHMGLACLNKILPEPDTDCFTMGWGRLFNEKNKYAVVLKKVSNLPTLERNFFWKSQRKTRTIG